MIRWLRAYVRAINSLNSRAGIFLGGLVFVLMFILLYEAIARYVFNAPTLWALEAGGFVLGAYFIIGGGYTLLREGHVRMDVLYYRWSPRTKAIMDLATFSLLAFYLVLLIWTGGKHAVWSIMVGEKSRSTWHPILWPIKMVIPVGGLFILLQGIAFLINDLSIVFRGKALE